METNGKTRRDRAGAALIVALGVATVAVGSTYRLGTLTRMGAGYVPMIIGVLMIAVGLLLFVPARKGSAITPALAVPTDTAAKPSLASSWRGWLCIVGGVVAFVVLGRWGGLAPATFASVFVAAMGDRENDAKGAALLAFGITVLGALIFNVGLKLPFPLFTWG